jgi:outer membrane protein insertion porin family
LELIFPTPFISDEVKNSVRTSLFIDGGNIWDTEFDYANLSQLNNLSALELIDYSDASLYRLSSGVSLQWLSPMGPMIFSFARALKKREGDRVDVFSFNVGTTF